MTEVYHTPYGPQMIAAATAAAAIKVGVTTANLDEGSWILFGGSLRAGRCDSSHPWTASESALKGIHSKLAHLAAANVKGGNGIINMDK